MREGLYRPRLLDYFPHTRRGHGSTHPDARVDKHGLTVRKGCPCVNSACSLLRRQNENGKTARGEAHLDQYANVADWKVDHGKHKDLALEDCF